MYGSVTIFKNHKSKVFCTHSDSTRFSILDCQSITANAGIIRCEKEDAIHNGFREVTVSDFETILKKDNPTLNDSLKSLNDSLDSLCNTLEKYLQRT